MKSILIIALVALVACGNFENSVLDLVQCVLKNENIKEQALNVFKSFKTKDFPTIFSTIISAYLAVKDDVKECLTPKPSLRRLSQCLHEDYYQRCRERCKGMLHMICKKHCYNCWCL